MANDLPALSDPDLVLRIRRGDEAALGTLYDRHGRLLYGSVLRFVGDRQLAEEVVQDTFVALWRGADRFDATAGGLAGWLLRIARNRAIDRLRAAARRPALVELAELPGSGTDGWDGAAPMTVASDPSADPAVTAEREWARALVRTALSTMPEPERITLELAYGHELTQAEIADRLGWPLGTVKSRTRRALASLRTALEGVPELADTAAAMPELASASSAPHGKSELSPATSPPTRDPGGPSVGHQGHA